MVGKLPARLYLRVHNVWTKNSVSRYQLAMSWGHRCSKRLISTRSSFCCVMLLLTFDLITVAETKALHKPKSTHESASSPISTTAGPAAVPQAASPMHFPSPLTGPLVAGPAPSQEDPLTAQIVRGLDAFPQYRTVATGIDSAQTSLIRSDMTLFAPNDEVLSGVHLTGQSALALLRFHVVTQRFTFEELSDLRVGSRLSTALSNISVVITDNAAGQFKVDNALIINPDMFVSKDIAVHGIDGVFDASAYNTAVSLGPSPSNSITDAFPGPLPPVSPITAYAPSFNPQGIGPESSGVCAASFESTCQAALRALFGSITTAAVLFLSHSFW